jgi:xanthine dehydrogenase accessory factor
MKLWNFIKSKLEAEQKIILLILIDSIGSSPGKKGFGMAVCDDGEISGSIGGGVVEYNHVERARKLFAKPGEIFSVFLDHKTNSENSSGLICSGSQQVAYYPLDKNHLPLVNEIADAEDGNLIFTETGIFFQKETSSQTSGPKEVLLDSWYYEQKIGIGNKLYIFGAGHVSLAVSKVLSELDFEVIVFDNRNDSLNTYVQNSFVKRKMIINYNDAAQHVNEGDNVYVLILTFDHKSDAKVLKQMIGKDLRYLGMMGSKKKVNTIFSDLKEKGISEERLNLVDAPVGIQINSETPEEIAISIAAKLIQIKNEN